MNRKIVTFVIIFIISLPILALVFYYSFISVRIPYFPAFSDSLIYPMSKVTKTGSWGEGMSEKGTYVMYETTHKDVTKYYEEILKKQGWTENLIPKRTDGPIPTCGGLWERIYEKDKRKFHIMICGFDYMVGSTKNITFNFYNDDKPEDFLGSRFSQ